MCLSLVTKIKVLFVLLNKTSIVYLFFFNNEKRTVFVNKDEPITKTFLTEHLNFDTVTKPPQLHEKKTETKLFN